MPKTNTNRTENKLISKLKRQVEILTRDKEALNRMLDQFEQEIKQFKEQHPPTTTYSKTILASEVNVDESKPSATPEEKEDTYSETLHQCDECGVCERLRLTDLEDEDSSVGACQGCGSEVYEIQYPCEKCLKEGKKDPSTPYKRCKRCTSELKSICGCDQDPDYHCDKCTGTGKDLLDRYNEIHLTCIH